MRNLQESREKAMRLMNERLTTMELLEDDFNNRQAEGNEIEIVESSCVAGQEYRELLEEVQKLMMVISKIDEELASQETEETEEVEEVTTEDLLCEVFGVDTNNNEIDEVINAALKDQKRKMMARRI